MGRNCNQKDAVDKLHDNKRVIYVDSWTGHKDEELYQIPGKEVIVKVFPEHSTSLVQPLDLYIAFVSGKTSQRDSQKIASFST